MILAWMIAALIAAATQAVAWVAFRQGLTRRQVVGIAFILPGGGAALRLQG